MRLTTIQTWQLPVLLSRLPVFHSGGLVTGSHAFVHPLARTGDFSSCGDCFAPPAAHVLSQEVCVRNKWPLISASYRLLPQAKASGLLEDAKAAYDFTRRWEITDESAPKRKVNVGGGSAGFFMAALTAHHLTPTPIALLSITGITTFRHHFFNSSVLLTPEPVTLAQQSSTILPS
ncbi:hypothetical protein Cob_v007308 [Colletotrichum orbiculare MAFF 240422]|uniref:Alpha/beta hydrolase fold-3 domain-containing protein n=1 Tax=Colletotrichum orbiculare (strain 104-T / ATCC 96160 / CBS 514.97 / LARS 414 / MAFF 240422) TaxID=1213857 RepID=A0A484FQW5_COLOR|nr:hypothetical protein Cob_v007308 [Colletotrichum orbiculare MAFF 240422]